MKISYVTTYNALDIHSWSGLGYMIANALAGEEHDLEFIGELQAKPSLEMYFRKAYYKALGKDYDFGRNRRTAAQHARQIKQRLSKDTDVIFSPGTIPVSLLDVDKPKVIYTDATFAGMVGFYDYLSNLSRESVRDGHFLEQSALDSCRLAIYSSDWAAQTAIDHYGVSPEKIKVVPFGSNIENENSLEDIQTIVGQKSRKECHLLFLAVDWKRKGGDMAVKIASKLTEAGLKTTLHIVGIAELPASANLPFVKSYGFVSKSSEQGRSIISKLLRESHFLLLPTIADCTPVVFSEANAFGLPCISTTVGGIPTIIKDGLNGWKFQSSQDENAYAECIFNAYGDERSYNELALSSFNEYQSRLNWRVAGQSITRLLNEM